MKRLLIFLCALIGFVSQCLASEPLSGVNVVNPQWLDAADQADRLKDLQSNGVTAIRVPLTAPYDKSEKFILDAAKAGLHVLVIVQVNDRRALRKGAKVRPGGKRTWDLYPLTDVDVPKFKANFSADLAKLEAAGFNALGFEVGNEINWAPFNGDLSLGNKGRLLAGAALAGSDQAAIRNSFDHYLEMVKAVKEVRDRSRLNKDTPIISAGLADVHAGQWLANSGYEGVSVDATLAYLRSHGLDSLVDAYGIHEYPDIRQPWAKQRSDWWSKALAQCGVDGGKPCWVTEWGYSNTAKACNADDTQRADLVRKAKEYLAVEAGKGRVQRAFYFNWATQPFQKKSFAQGVFRCGKLMPAGNVLLGR